MKRKRLLVEILASLLFLAGGLIYIHRSELRTDTRLCFQLKSRHGDIPRLFADDDRPLRAWLKPGKEFQTVLFYLPKKEMRHLRLELGEKPGTRVIGEIRVHALFKTFRWPDRSLKRFFKRPPAGTRIEAKDNLLYIRCRQKSPSLDLDEAVAPAINRLSREKTVFYIAALLLCLIFFYLIHNVRPANLRIFLAPNMVLLFLLLIALPLLCDLFNLGARIDVPRLQEKRVLARKPPFRFDSLSRFPARYQDYYNDHFQFRSLLIPLNNFARVGLFRLSPIPQLLVGKQGWLFLAKEGQRGDEVEYFRALEPYTCEELEQWRIGLEQRRDWLAAKGIPYLFVVAPNKSTVYPEFMPKRIRRVGKESRLDQLTDYLTKHSDMRLLDLRQAMLVGKKERRVYRKADSHWNGYGAFVTYREIMAALARFFAQAKARPLSDFTIRSVRRSGGDLAIMLSLQNSLFLEEAIYLNPRFPRHARRGNPLDEKFPGVTLSVSECAHGNLPTALVVHDSFANRLKPFLSEHFKRIIYIRDWDLHFYPDLIEQENVKLVIDQTTERFLLTLRPTNPPQIAHPASASTK